MLASQGSAGNGVKEHLFFVDRARRSTSGGLHYALSDPSGASHLAGGAFLYLFIDRGNARQPEGVVSAAPLTPPGLEGENPVCASSWEARRAMSVQSRHWLDYDSVALVVLLVGMSAVALLALSI
jgi:hypothetical protein